MLRLWRTKNVSIIDISSQEWLKMKNAKRFLTPCPITGLPRIGTVNHITTAQKCFPFQFQWLQVYKHSMHAQTISMK